MYCTAHRSIRKPVSLPVNFVQCIWFALGKTSPLLFCFCYLFFLLMYEEKCISYYIGCLALAQISHQTAANRFVAGVWPSVGPCLGPVSAQCGWQVFLCGPDGAWWRALLHVVAQCSVRSSWRFWGSSSARPPPSYPLSHPHTHLLTQGSLSVCVSYHPSRCVPRTSVACTRESAFETMLH